MTAESVFDIRTMLMCHMLMGCVFGVVLGGMHFTYPNLRGLGLLSLGFLMGLPGVVLVALRGHIPYWVSVVVGNTLIHLCYLLFYCGTVYFVAGGEKVSRLRLTVMMLAVAVTAGALTYYSMVEDRIVPRIVAVALMVAFQFGMLAVDLWSQAEGRLRLRLFSGFTAVYAAVNLARAILTPVLGTSEDLMKAGGIQMWSMFAGVVFTTGIGIFFLLSVAAELRRSVERQALHDLLTGVLNRAGIEARLGAELERSKRNRRSFCVALIDLDHFKSINDSGGHAAGDSALRMISGAISTGLRSYDVLGRYGGDEFLLVLPDTSVKEACAVLYRMRAQIAMCEVPAGVSIGASSRRERASAGFTISAGIAGFANGDSMESLLARADDALYDAKHAGRDCIRYRLSDGLAVSSQRRVEEEAFAEDRRSLSA